MRSDFFSSATVCLLLTAIAGCSGTEPDTPVPLASSPPRIQIGHPDRDLGEVPLASHVEKFEIRNVGTEPLVIRALEKTCGCVKVRITETTIPGGAQGVLEVQVGPRQPEVRSATVTVHSNDPTAESTRVVLSWTARGPVSVEPLALDFGTIRPGIRASRIVHVTQDLRQIERERDLKMHGTPAGLFTAERLNVARSDESIDEEWQIELLVDRDTVESSGHISLADPSDRMPIVQIRASWKARELIDVSPATLFLGSEQPSQRVRRSVQVSCDADKLLEITRLEHVGTLISVERKTVVLSPQLTRIDINAILPDRPGTYLEQVTIVCREPFDRTLELPISCIVLSPSAFPSP